MSRKAFIAKTEGTSPAYRRSKKQEKELAKRGGGRLVSRSGAGPEKGDIKKYNKIFRVEAKTTAKKSFSVTRDMLRKLEDAALPHNELPAIFVEFIDEQGNVELELAVVPTYVLDEVLLDG